MRIACKRRRFAANSSWTEPASSVASFLADRVTGPRAAGQRIDRHRCWLNRPNLYETLMQEYTGANFDLGGLFVSAKGQWKKDISILTTNSSDEVVAATSFNGEAWQLNFVNFDSTTPVVTVTTANGITFNATTAVLSLNVSSTVISALDGDYDADLSSATTGGVITHHAHGRVTFIQQPYRST